jgi:hypothetical protein
MELKDHAVNLGLFELECRRCLGGSTTPRRLARWRVVADGLGREARRTTKSRYLLADKCTNRRIRVVDDEEPCMGLDMGR